MNSIISRENRHILFVTLGYPSEYKPLYPFLEALVKSIRDLGVQCTVINPVSAVHALIRHEKLPPVIRKTYSDEGNVILVRCPRYMTCSTGRFLRHFRNTFNLRSFMWAIRHSIKKNHIEFNTVYGHFVSPSGIVASILGKERNITACFAYGESSPYLVDEFGVEKTREMLKNINCTISVSSENTKYLRENKIVRSETIGTFINGVNRSIFYPRNRVEMRKKYNIPLDAFVVAHLGSFNFIKGATRLSEALDMLGNVHSIFMGSGEMKPTCSNIDYIGSVPHDQTPELLSAADIFVLATNAEGCCNAILEALACGLPVVSSDRSFNDDTLKENYSIRVDTMNPAAIADAIATLRDGPELRLKMSKEALKASENFDIHRRAENILRWIEQCEERNENDTHFSK